MARAEVLDSSDYFMAVAVLSAQRSNDPSTQVGACIVKKNEVVGTGYNGMPNGCDDAGLPWARADAAPWLETKHPYVCHAELNAIINNSADVRGCTIYVTLFPCKDCAKLIIQAGIKKVVYLSDKYKHRADTKDSKKLLKEAEIPSMEFKPDMTNIDIDFKSTNQPAKCSKK